ncbi:HNH endonuclease signature motif containing protein [Leptospira santarosai]|uniref:HNH endonuclease signature motif containing protein n=1 Tax=Leptospira santarosai TaxID=28183 RepID=UPI0024AF48C7|nr:HNH endonuclease signature motif containing protein [Leptospira santarosai]MDI7175262.1 HNH endonuclease signature motif containing protein [Leptospira santarosai]MDI7194904.1 HNH endonuclease signature motif containing protein [Leptospira santarosai]MDO6399315.1 HNH endonuclease signature motif containing protein [Leptospira santarosai]MDO6404745.1 HNH endonuclease signature motif containing protein [Leptospira santarosai]
MGQSGNLCAICKIELIVDKTNTDQQVIVGEECHIISQRIKGPRYIDKFPKELIDDYENLILLCNVHHKMIDDQPLTYSVDVIKLIKNNHESQIREKLQKKKGDGRVSIRRKKENMSEFLRRITDGKGFYELISNVYGCDFQFDEKDDNILKNFVAPFLQNVQDWVDISSDLIQISQKIEVMGALTNSIREIESSGFLVFGGVENQILTDMDGVESNFPVCIIKLIALHDPDIIQMPIK